MSAGKSAGFGSGYFDPVMIALLEHYFPACFSSSESTSFKKICLHALGYTMNFLCEQDANTLAAP
jgi:hypothetical protein